MGACVQGGGHAPFSESSECELIGGFVIVEVPSIDEAVRRAQTYAEAVAAEEGRRARPRKRVLRIYYPGRSAESSGAGRSNR
jgi:hypothetical protein